MTYKLLAVFALLPSMVCADAAGDLMDKLSNIKSFEAKFVQSIAEKNQEAFTESSGYLKILRPGRFYWQSQEPDEILVVADGDSIWTYDMELEQIVQNDQTSTMGQSPAAILAGEVVDLENDYVIETVKANACLNQADACYKLTPKDNETAFKEVKIGFAGQALQSIEIQDALDQTIETTFTDITINGKVDKSLFEFTPPPGVDLIKGKQ